MRPYDLPNVESVGYDVVTNRPKVAAYRAPGAPISAFGVESCLDELAGELGIDPLALREMNGAKDGTKAAHGPTWVNIGYLKTLEAARGDRALKAKLGPNQGRGVACGFWFNAGGESSAAVHVNEDGTVTVTEGHPDIGGSRASMAMMVAEVLGVPFESVRPVVGDTTAIGFSASTGGSRVTFAGGMAVTQATQKVVEELKKRAAVTWDISPEAVEWKDGKALPAGPNAGGFEPLPLGGARGQIGAHRRPDQRRGADQRAGPGARLRHPHLRCRGRSRDRPRQDPALYRDPGCRPGDPSLLCRGADAGRGGAGGRLGVERGIHLRQGRQARKRRVSSTTACRSPRTCR